MSAKPLGDALKELIEFESLDAPVVSLYWQVPADAGQLKAAISELKDLVKVVHERATADGVSREVRMSLRADADRILEFQHLTAELRGRTLALFRCNERAMECAVIAPGHLSGRIELDARPYVGPLVMVQDEAHRYAVVVVDREHAAFFEFYLGVLEARQRRHGQALRNPNYAAGDREYATHHKVEDLGTRHYRESAEELRAFVENEGIELVVVGGHQDSVPAFVDLLARDLRPKVVGTFIVDPHTMTPASVREAAQLAIDDYERRQQTELVAQAMDRVRAGGFGALGLEWCLLATDELAVELLLVDDGVKVPGRECERCGWLGLQDVKCPIDGNPTRPVPDVVDEMVVRILESSGHIRHVRPDTRLHDHLVAALLRFPVPRPEAVPD